ncbi:hypothetical protein ABZP36_033291 [Zizania latifolia]
MAKSSTCGIRSYASHRIDHGTSCVSRGGAKAMRAASATGSTAASRVLGGLRRLWVLILRREELQIPRGKSGVLDSPRHHPTTECLGTHRATAQGLDYGWSLFVKKINVQKKKRRPHPLTRFKYPVKIGEIADGDASSKEIKKASDFEIVERLDTVVCTKFDVDCDDRWTRNAKSSNDLLIENQEDSLQRARVTELVNLAKQVFEDSDVRQMSSQDGRFFYKTR